MALPKTLSGSNVIAVQQANQVPIPPPGREYIFRDASDLLLYTKNSNGTITAVSAILPDLDVKVAVSAIDTTADYLAAKLVAGTNITLTPSGAGNETLTVDAAGGSGSMLFNATENLVEGIGGPASLKSNTFVGSNSLLANSLVNGDKIKMSVGGQFVAADVNNIFLGPNIFQVLADSQVIALSGVTFPTMTNFVPVGFFINIEMVWRSATNTFEVVGTYQIADVIGEFLPVVFVLNPTIPIELDVMKDFSDITVTTTNFTIEKPVLL